MNADRLRELARRCEADAAALAQDRRGEADTLTEAADLLLILAGDREGSSSASRQHYIDTGRHLPAGPACSECDSTELAEYGMCAGCLHDAYRSGWSPGD